MNPEAAKGLFARCLPTCLSADLWRSYVQFVRKVRVRWLGGWLRPRGCLACSSSRESSF